MSLSDLRVLEVSGGERSSGTAAVVAVAWAAKLFADLGADVIRVEPDGIIDPVRTRPHEIHRWLHTNKRSVRTGHAELVVEADLVLHDGSSRELIDRDRPVVCSITPFGATGPYAGYSAEELTIIHGSSWGFLSPSGATDQTKPPLKAPGHHATLNVATIAATAALAAVLRRRRFGQRPELAEHIDVSLFAAAAKMTEFAPAAASYLNADASRLGGKTVVPWGVFECADGLVQIICPEQSQWESLVEMMGRPEWALMDVVATAEARRENADLVMLYLGQWMAEQQVDDLAIRAQQAHVCITPVATMAQLAENQHFAERGFFAAPPDDDQQPGPGYRLDQPWWSLRTSAPEPGEHEAQGWRPRPERLAVTIGSGHQGNGIDPGVQTSRSDRHDQVETIDGVDRPLAGVRVCDFTWIWAGPFCTQYLGHLGAEVIKLESPEHLCMFRRLPFAPAGVSGGVDGSGAFHIYNSDKLSLALDIGHSAAAEVVEKLVAASDVVIDNFGVGTMARLGYGVEDLRAMNPNIVVASLSGYGQTGQNAHYMAYGPAGGSLSGLYAINGYVNGPAMETGIAIGDPCTGITAAWAVVAALAGRDRGEPVPTVDVSMVEAVAATVGEPWMAYQADGRNPDRVGNHDPLWAPHNCYPAAGDDRWVTITCTDDDGWRQLASLIDTDLIKDQRFATAALRKEHEAALDDIIARWTANRDRWDVTRTLQAAGVAAFPSLSPMDLWGGDQQLEAIGMLERPSHPVTGARVVPGIPWRLRHGPNGLRAPAPLLGQHTDHVLTELLGFDRTKVEELRRAGVIPEPSP